MFYHQIIGYFPPFFLFSGTVMMYRCATCSGGEYPSA